MIKEAGTESCLPVKILFQTKTAARVCRTGGKAFCQWPEFRRHAAERFGTDGCPVAVSIKKGGIMKGYKEIPADRMPGNVIEMIGRQWMLVTAGSGEQCNTMTASWGGIGVIWGQPAATVYIRPQRYTREFVDAEPRLTLSFMGEEYRRALAYCGAHSGRTEEKIARAGLTVEYTPVGTPCIGGAEIVLECRKMYRDRFGPAEFLEKELIDAWYPEKDFHYLYICAIEKVYVRE